MTREPPRSVLRARLQLMLREPYLAQAVARLPVLDVTELGWCDTMATDGYHIFLNATFCEGLDEEELAFVLAHELMHCVLGHMDRRGHRDRFRWNVAVDYATNLLLVDAGMKIPKEALFDRTFHGMTSEEIYDRLPARLEGGAPGSGLGGNWDRHVEADDLEGSLFRSGSAPSAEERRRVRRQLASAVSAHLPGTAAGRFSQEIAAATTPRIPWQAHLARFFGGLRRSDYRLFPPNRKHIWRSLYLPSMGVPGPGHIAVAVDTSGSMSDELLSRLLAEIDGLRSVTQCELTVVEFDHEIQQTTRFESVEMGPRSIKRHTFRGRGGTDIRLTTSWLAGELKSGRHPPPEALIIMTDGFGPMPDREPQIPVLWVLPEEGASQVPFGTLLRVGRE